MLQGRRVCCAHLCGFLGYRVCWAFGFVPYVVFFLTAFGGRFVSCLTRESLCQSPQSNQRACPYLGSTLRSDFPPSVVAPGVGVQGHPWPHAFRGSCRST